MAPARPNSRQVVWLSAFAFFQMLSYALSRPTTESLFLEAHGSERLPLVWLLLAFCIWLVVEAYNRLVTRLALVRVWAWAAACSAALLSLLLALQAAGLPGVYYLLYVWKDIYVIVLVEVFYSYTNGVFPVQSARWAYGLFGAMGALGGITGNLLVDPLAHHLGTLAVLWLVPGLLLGIAVGCIVFSRIVPSSGSAPAPVQNPGRFSALPGALGVVRRSSYLFLLVGCIALLQIISTLIDFSYNHVLENAYPLTDQRTAIIGRIYAVVDAATLVLNALTGPLLRLFGVPLILLGIPVLLSAGLAVFALHPRLVTAAAVKVGNKCFDYTLFRTAKEILYIPLGTDERTRGKSIVDMLTHRLAKAAASFLLLLLGASAFLLAAPVTIALVALWFALTLLVVRRFRAKVSRAAEMLRVR